MKIEDCYLWIWISYPILPPSDSYTEFQKYQTMSDCNGYYCYKDDKFCIVHDLAYPDKTFLKDVCRWLKTLFSFWADIFKICFTAIFPS